MENYSKATIQTLMQRKMSVELRVTSKGEGILTLVGTKVINWVRGKYKINYETRINSINSVHNKELRIIKYKVRK